VPLSPGTLKGRLTGAGRAPSPCIEKRTSLRLLDHLIGGDQKRLRHRESKRFGSLEIKLLGPKIIDVDNAGSLPRQEFRKIPP
jgi:hypothetical protein